MVFRRPDILRPPSERLSYFLPLTSGCSNNTCTFCGYYGVKLQVRDIEAIKQEIDAVALYRENGSRLPGIPPIVYYIAREWDGKRLFLQDGDALVYPFSRLKAVLEYIREKLPGVHRIGSYATAKDILRITVAELALLKELGLGILYTGLESGDDDILRRVDKGTRTLDMIEAGKKLRTAGITNSVTVILGLAGFAGSENHALQTARVLSEIDPEFIGALTLTLVPGTPLYSECEKGNFTPVSPFQSLNELKTIIENVTLTRCFFSSMHASNYISVRGFLPQDKPRMVNDLNRIIQSSNPELLRPEFLRGL